MGMPNIAPRITPADIDAEIAWERYFTASDGVHGASEYRLGSPSPGEPHPLDHVTICVLILRNGHKVIGVNTGPVSPANFDPNLGRKLARENAVDQIWPLLGFRLRDRLAAHPEGIVRIPVVSAPAPASDYAGTGRGPDVSAPTYSTFPDTDCSSSSSDSGSCAGGGD